MFLPTQFNSTDLAQACDLMRAHPFASLVSNDDDGFPFVTPLPLHLETPPENAAARDLVLLGHVSKGNPHWHYLRQRPSALVCFLGPHAYMSPRVYPDLVRVPTWNYLTVQCRVEAHLLDGHATKDALLKQLIGDHEPPYANQWRGLPEDYADRMLSGIVAFELRVQALECKIKLNQHRPEAHARMYELYSAGNDNERELAQWMARLGKTGAA